MTHLMKLDEVIKSCIDAGATKKHPFDFYHGWLGWVTKDVLHVVPTSGAAKKDVWHFALNKGNDTLVFVNTASVAFVYATTEAEYIRKRLSRCAQKERQCSFEEYVKEEKVYTDPEFLEYNSFEGVWYHHTGRYIVQKGSVDHALKWATADEIFGKKKWTNRINISGNMVCREIVDILTIEEAARKTGIRKCS